MPNDSAWTDLPEDPEAAAPGALPLMSLEDPAPDRVKLAEGHGVTARRVANAAGLDEALRAALAVPGPDRSGA